MNVVDQQHKKHAALARKAGGLSIGTNSAAPLPFDLSVWLHHVVHFAVLLALRRSWYSDARFSGFSDKQAQVFTSRTGCGP
jgi:hypothetical protein